MTSKYLEEMVERIIENPQRILNLDYDMVCELIFTLYCSDYLDVAEICVRTLSEVHDKDKLSDDLNAAALRITQDILTIEALEKMYNEKDS